MRSDFPTSAMGYVDAIYVKPVKGAPFRPVDAAEAINGVGFADDVHGDPFSPRQILLASSAAYTDFDLPQHALRENLRITADTERMYSGQLLQIGNQVIISLTFQCEACARLGAGTVGVIAKRRGMLARVVQDGAIHSGDAIFSVGQSSSTWSDNWQDRVKQVLEMVPEGHVIEFSQIARLGGIDISYCRAFPGLLKRLTPSQAKKAVPADGPGIRWAGTSLADKSLLRR